MKKCSQDTVHRFFKIRFLAQFLATAYLAYFFSPIQSVEANLDREVRTLICMLSQEYKEGHPVVTREQQIRAYREVAWMALDYLPYLEGASQESIRPFVDVFVSMAKNGPFPAESSHFCGFFQCPLYSGSSHLLNVLEGQSDRQPLACSASASIDKLWSGVAEQSGSSES